VSSGTTSKQIAKETDCRAVGYGGMLLEGLVALIALATVMVLPRESVASGFSPDRVYAEGLARFVEHFGVPRDFARSFVLLAFTTFIYDTLDVATRLARYILQELVGWKGAAGRTAATALSLALPLACVSMTLKDAAGNVVPAWKVFWTIFGTSNQLLAALTLLVIALWLKRLGKSWWLAGLPSAFMMAMTLWALGILARPGVARLFSAAPAFDPVGLVAVLLFALAALVLVESWKSLSARR
jgi:carbon starvation protein